jgi:DNA-binding transcriptional LysR family regulator
MKYTLRQLEVFLATARLQNLSRAAQSLAMSQSAASDSLRDLEKQFDLQLFDRVGKRLQLNAHGLMVLPRAEELLSRAAELEGALHGHRGESTLRLGATISIGNHLCIPLINRYHQRYPDSRINLDISNTESITQRVASFELDIGLIEGEINHPLLEVIPWRDDELTLFAGAKTEDSKHGKLVKRELLGAKWVLRENGSGTRQTFNRVMHDLLPQLKIVLEVQHPEAIIQAVRSGMGWGCLSRLSLAEPLQRGEVVALSAQGRQFKRKFYLITHKQKFRSNAMEDWISLCLQDGGNLLP